MAKKKKRAVPVALTREEKKRASRTFRVEAPKRRSPLAVAAKQRSGAGPHGSKKRYRRRPKHKNQGERDA